MAKHSRANNKNVTLTLQEFQANETEEQYYKKSKTNLVISIAPQATYNLRNRTIQANHQTMVQSSFLFYFYIRKKTKQISSLILFE